MANKMFYQKGNYLAQVIGQGISQNENTKNYQFELRIKILAWDNGDGTSEADHDQYDRTIRYYFTDKGIEVLEKALDKLGWNDHNPASYSQLNLGEPNSISFVGQEISVYCSENTYNGDTREQWGISGERTTYEIKAAPPAAIRKLDQMFGSGLKRGARASMGKGGTAVATRPATNLHITDADLPDNMQDDAEDLPF